MTESELIPFVSLESRRPRRPVRASGIARYESLLDALEELLTRKETEEIGLPELARVADAPVASVYHFFPEMSAALVALAERYMDRFVEMMEQPFDMARVGSWEDLLVQASERSREYYNAHPVVLKLILGPDQSWSIREMDLQNNRRLARFFLAACAKHFEFPTSDSLVAVFEVAITMNDAVWSLSYARHGSITDAFAREAQRAVRGYLRGYLPAFAPIRRR
ncbi:MAG: TetR/AcrR family transcriptional regulator [Myxococcota bacterium]